MGARHHQAPTPPEALPPVEAVREWIEEGLRAVGGECHRSMVLHHIARRAGLPATPDLENWMVRAFEAEVKREAAAFEPRFGPGSHRWRLRS
ncbi:MAG: hypothetical protein ACKN9P_00470 [Phenylobacterium sp.]